MKTTKTKTKILIYSCNKESQVHLTLNGVVVKKYFGSKTTENGRCVKEIISRINQAKRAFQNERSLFTF